MAHSRRYRVGTPIETAFATSCRGVMTLFMTNSTGTLSDRVILGGCGNALSAHSLDGESMLDRRLKVEPQSNDWRLTGRRTGADGTPSSAIGHVAMEEAAESRATTATHAPQQRLQRTGSR
jgi:hypothetical protein